MILFTQSGANSRLNSIQVRATDRLHARERSPAGTPSASIAEAEVTLLGTAPAKEDLDRLRVEIITIEADGAEIEAEVGQTQGIAIEIGDEEMTIGEEIGEEIPEAMRESGIEIEMTPEVTTGIVGIGEISTMIAEEIGEETPEIETMKVSALVDTPLRGMTETTIEAVAEIDQLAQEATTEEQTKDPTQTSVSTLIKTPTTPKSTQITSAPPTKIKT